MAPGKGYGSQLAEIDDAALAQAQEMFESGRTYIDIAKYLGTTEGWTSTYFGGPKNEPMTTEQLAAYREAIPPDTRPPGERAPGRPSPAGRH
jgi:hypothetical protein